MKVKMKVYGWINYKEFLDIIRRRAIMRVKCFPLELWQAVYILACFLNLFCPYCTECSSFVDPMKCKLFYRCINRRVYMHSCYMKQTKVALTVRILNFLNHCIEKIFGVDSDKSYPTYGSYKGKIFRRRT